MSVVENNLDDRVGPLTGRSYPWDPFIYEDISDTPRMRSNTSLHGCIKTLWFSTEIIPVTIDHFAFFWQIDLAIMNRCSRCLKCPDQTQVTVFFRVKFESKIGLFPFFVQVPSLFLRVFASSPWGVSAEACPGSEGDECRILDHTFPDLQSFSFQLPLEFLPNCFVLFSFG